MRFLPALLVLAACARQAPVPGYTLGTDGLPIVDEDPDSTLPFDPRVRKGVLDNGLTWYIEPNQRPAGRAEIRLVVKVGSIVEEDDERGVAHYLEHLAFNGTEHFPGRSLVAWLEGIGMRFGADLNAFTSFDETVYLLQVPTDDPALLERALLVVRDWADGIVFDDEECAKERGVVLEEWRQSGGFSERLQEQTLPLTFHGSRYPDRRPIGGESAIQALDCDVAERFHARWYRPDLMGVIVVGDVDVDATEAVLREQLGDLPAAGKGAPARPWYTVPDHDEILVSQVTDPEITNTLVTVMHKADAVESPKTGGYEQFLVGQLAFLVLTERLGLRSTDPGSPFLGAGASPGGLGHGRESHLLQAAVKPGRLEEGLDELLMARRSLKVHGVTDEERDRAVRSLATNMEAYYAERDKTDTTTHADELQRNFLEDEPVPGIPYEYALSRTMLPTIDTARVNAYLASDVFYPATGRVVQVLAPEGTSLPDDETLRAMVVAADTATPPAPEGEAASLPLVPEPPAPGSVTVTDRDEALGTTTLSLSNGITVVVRPTELQADNIVLSGFKKGGSAALPSELYLSGLVATDVAQASGLQGMSVADLARQLIGRAVDADVSIEGWNEVFFGNSTRAEWPTMLELLHARVTRARFDQAVFDEMMAARRDQVRLSLTSPEARLHARWQALVWDGHPHFVPWTEADLDGITLASVERAWALATADLSDTVLFVVGNLTPDEAVEALAQWVATLPATAADPGIVSTTDDARRVAGPVSEVLVDPGAVQATVRVLFHAPAEDGQTERMVLNGMGSLLEARLHEELREELGGTYGVSVSETIERNPVQEAVVTIEFSCDPARVDELLTAMDAVIEEIRTEVWPDAVMGSFREKNLRERQSSVQSNFWWAGAMAGHWRRGEAPTEILAFDESNAQVRAERIRDVAEALLVDAHRIQLVQTPLDPAAE